MLGIRSFASEKAHVVIVAIDDSGSMKQSDPQGVRLEATSMVVRSASSDDQFGIIAFGNDARWLLRPAARPNQAEIGSALSQIHSADQHTDFVTVLSLIKSYVEDYSNSLSNYDVSVVLLTDGSPDPGPQYAGGADQNRRESIEIANTLANRGVHLYTIGLGRTVQSDFLTQISNQSSGFYSPARTPEELRDAFLKSVTRIFSLPAYAEVQGQSRVVVHIGQKPDVIRAYLFRQEPATILVGVPAPFLSSQHIAAYDLPIATDVAVQVGGPTAGASIVICVRQPLSFVEDPPTSPALLVDSNQKIQVRLLAGGEPQWDRLFMRDAAVNVRFHSASDSDIVQPLYPDPNSRSYRGLLPTDRPGEYQASIQLMSPYGEVDHFLGKLEIAETAIRMPSIVMLEYPSFLPASLQRVFGAAIPLEYGLKTGSARLVFEKPQDFALSGISFEIDPGHKGSARIFAAGGRPSGTFTLPYTVFWTNGQEQEVRRGLLTVQASPLGPIAFLKIHWLLFTLSGILLVVLYVLRRTPNIKGVLVVEMPGTVRRRITLSPLRAKRITVSESATKEDFTSRSIVVRAGTDRNLFALTMCRSKGRWLLQVDRVPGVPLQAPATLKHGSQIVVKDPDLTFTFYAGK